MYTVKYASLNYYPDIYLLSNMVVGVFSQIISDTSIQENKVEFISKMSKLHHFDDELDMNFTKVFLEGVKDQFKNSYNDLNDFKRVFVNNFKFSNVKEAQFKSYKEAQLFVNKTEKYILHIGLSKDKRLKSKERKEYIYNHILKKYDNQHVKKNKKIESKIIENDSMRVDYLIHSNISNEDVGYKLINHTNNSTFNSKPYILYSLINGTKIVLVVEDDMLKDKKTIEKIIEQSKASNVKVLTEKELIFND